VFIINFGLVSTPAKV